MTSTRDRLAALRAEIDRIDDRLLELLIERMAVVERIAATKNSDNGDALALRPAREAAILRRLVGAAGASFPDDTLVPVWRELFAAATRAQTPFAAAVCEQPPELARIARDHLGAVTPLISVSGAAHGLRLIEEGRAGLAIVALPRGDERWWADLAASEDAPAQVVGRLPFLRRPDRNGSEALMLAPLAPEPSGDDRSLFVLETREEFSRSRLLAGFTRARLDPVVVATQPEAGRARYLLDLAGFLDEHAPAVVNAAALLRPALLRLRRIGTYPTPLGWVPTAKATDATSAPSRRGRE